MQRDSPEVRELCLPKIHYFIFDHIVSTDKMAELFFHFGRFLADLSLVSPKKSSTFAASKEKEISINQIKQQNYGKILEKALG